MNDRAPDEEVILPSPNPLHLPQSALKPVFVNPNAEGLPWVEIGMDIMFKYLMFAKYQELEDDESLIGRY